ncbi:MAG: phosphate signaling complex protein PhoU [Thermoplasmatota archaeon]
MTEKFHSELDALKSELMAMGRLSCGMLRDSVGALKDLDAALAREVLDRRRELAARDDAIEEKALRLIALHQPVASDLRTLACILKIDTYLTRIGRYGKDIAQVALELVGRPHLARLVSIPHMAGVAAGMVEDALRAFETGDLSLLKDFGEKDDSLDAQRWSIFRECVTYMMEDPKNITQCAHYIMVAKYLERVADHACKMAEKIHYMVTGERIEVK